jgi:hypothetical protein
MALPSLMTKEAAAAVTAPVSAPSTVNHDPERLKPWIARHDREIQLPGPDGTCDWRNGSDGFFDEGQSI